MQAGAAGNDEEHRAGAAEGEGNACKLKSSKEEKGKRDVNE